MMYSIETSKEGCKKLMWNKGYCVCPDADGASICGVWCPKFEIYEDENLKTKCVKLHCCKRDIVLKEINQ